MKTVFATLAASSALLFPLAGYGQMGMMAGGGMMNMSGRQRIARQNGIGPGYAAKANPLAPTAGNIAEGKLLYQKNCALCHGRTGRGDGEAGRAMNPPPADIAASSKLPMASDGYLYWTVAEGGVPLGTAMPPFKSTLKADEIWKILIYLRSL